MNFLRNGLLPSIVRAHPLLSLLGVAALLAVSFVIQQLISYQTQLKRVEALVTQFTFPVGSTLGEIEASLSRLRIDFASEAWIDDRVGDKSAADIAGIDRRQIGHMVRIGLPNATKFLLTERRRLYLFFDINKKLSGQVVTISMLSL
jgi:Flp pilus assembly protein CpaB